MTYHFTYREASKALTFALSEDPFFVTVESSVSDDPEKAEEGMFRYMDYAMREAERYGELFVPEEERIGASIWTRPLDDVAEEQMCSERESFLERYLGEKCMEKHVRMTDFMSEKAKSIVPEDCWYLSILGIAPEMQGQGLGEGLVAPILDKTDELGASTYLETFTSRNKSFYKRLGYSDVASFTEPVGGSEYWLMLRDPA